MKNKKIWIIIVIAIVVLIMVNAAWLLWLRANLQEGLEEICVFANIDEIKLSSDITIKETNPKADAYIDGLEVVDSYCKKLLYHGKQVSLYAYVFAEERGAREYFQRYTGRGLTDNPKYNHSSSFGIFSSDFIVCHGKCLYRLYSTNCGALVDVLKIIRSNFSIVIC